MSKSNNDEKIRQDFPLFLSLIIELLCKLNTLIEVESIFLLKKIKNCFKK